MTDGRDDLARTLGGRIGGLPDTPVSVGDAYGVARRRKLPGADIHNCAFGPIYLAPRLQESGSGPPGGFIGYRIP